jgi:flagellar basal-body rod modification protein FlgD
MSTTSAAGVSSNVSDLPSVGAPAPKTASSELGKDEFLLLLTVQLKYQDPLKPVDNGQMIAQLAQFSQLEELQGLSSKIDAMTVATASSSQLTTTQLVGKQALFRADRIGLAAGQSSTFQLSLAEKTDDTTAVISDANGRVVRTLHLGAQAAGSRTVTWDGLDDTGKALPSGEYVLAVGGTKNDGSSVSATANVRATITGVAFVDGVAQLMVAGRQIPLSDVVEISTPPAGA